MEYNIPPQLKLKGNLLYKGKPVCTQLQLRFPRKLYKHLSHVPSLDPDIGRE